VEPTLQLLRFASMDPDSITPSSFLFAETWPFMLGD
jgi:hypothetical protein